MAIFTFGLLMLIKICKPKSSPSHYRSCTLLTYKRQIFFDWNKWSKRFLGQFYKTYHHEIIQHVTFQQHNLQVFAAVSLQGSSMKTLLYSHRLQNFKLSIHLGLLESQSRVIQKIALFMSSVLLLSYCQYFSFMISSQPYLS